MKTLSLARKDLLQIVRDRRALAFLVAMPLAFTLFMGFAFKGSPPPKDPRIPVGLVDRDSAAGMESGMGAASALVDALKASQALRVDVLAPGTGLEDAKALVNGGKYRGVLIIPSGWEQGLGKAEAGQLELLADPSSVEGQALYQAIRTPLGRVVGAVKIASIAAKAAPAPSGNAGARAASFRAGMELWREAAERGEPVRELPVSGAKAEGFAGGNPYNQSSPGMLVMFALFGLTSSAGLLVQERREGTLQRLRSTSMRSASILGGHFLAIFAVVMVQAAILVAFGQLALGVDYAAAPFGIGLVVVTLCAFTASAGLLIGSVARDAQQVTLFSLVAMFVLSALGGAWFPLEGAGKAFVAVAKTTPTAWAMTGFQNILVRGQGDATAVIPSVIVALWASALFALAAIRFRRAR